MVLQKMAVTTAYLGLDHLTSQKRKMQLGLAAMQYNDYNDYNEYNRDI